MCIGYHPIGGCAKPPPWRWWLQRRETDEIRHASYCIGGPDRSADMPSSRNRDDSRHTRRSNDSGSCTTRAAAPIDGITHEQALTRRRARSHRLPGHPSSHNRCLGLLHADVDTTTAFCPCCDFKRHNYLARTSIKPISPPRTITSERRFSGTMKRRSPDGDASAVEPSCCSGFATSERTLSR